MAATKSRRLDGYSGRLTVEQAADGIAAALANARSLVADATLLLNHGRWPRCAALSILAIEEAGKVEILRALLFAGSEQEVKEQWRFYRSHTKKNWMGAFLDFVTPSPTIEDFRGLFDPNAEHPQLLDSVKQLAFYSDCLGKAHWSIPIEVIDEAIARRLHATAAMAAPDSDPPITSLGELRLWVKHLKPVWGRNMLAMKEAMIACYQEAGELGVLRGQSSVEDAVRFLL